MSYSIKAEDAFKCTPIKNASSNESDTILALLQDFLSKNLKLGYLTFQVFQNSPLQGVLPVPNATVTLCRALGNNFYISKVLTTNEDGKTEPLALPTVSATLSQTPENDKVYSVYDAYVEAPNFLPSSATDIPIFEGITTIQPVNLIPSTLVNQPPSFGEKKDSK